MVSELRHHRPSSFEALRPLLAALRADLGPEFEPSLRAWFGLRQRPYVLDPWEIFVVRDEARGRDVGICGYYHHDGDAPGRFWLGWFGVIPEARHQGVGTHMLDLVEREASAAGATELWVYTEVDNQAAIDFYRRQGMQPRGRFADLGLPQAAATAESLCFAKALA